MAPGTALPAVRSLLAVCAHPDDESFGLGAALHAFARSGTTVAVLCFTHGEASTLGRVAPAELHDRRATELAAAGRALSLAHVDLLEHGDGALAEADLETLADEVRHAAMAAGAELLLVFDEGGVTGHPDHRRATEAALAAAGDLPVLAWAIPEAVADELNTTYGSEFVGRPADDIDLSVVVDRAVQRRAIECHASPAVQNPVLWRRLELLGDHEAFRWLRRPGPEAGDPARPDQEEDRGD